LELRHLETFHAAVRYGSFVRAAEALQYAQSTITLQVQQLEAELGVRLFEREGRGVRLTEAGRFLVDETAPILERMASMRQSMAELALGDAGHVRIGVIEPAAGGWLAPLVSAFCTARRNVRLTLDVAGTQTVSERVARGDLDAGLCSVPASRLGLRFEPLYVEPMALLMSEGDPLASERVVDASILSRSRLLLTDSGCAYREVVERAMDERGCPVRVGVEISSIAVMVRAVQSGVGAAIVPRAAACPAPAGTVFRDIVGMDLGLSVGLIERAEGAPGRALAALLAAIRAAAKDGAPFETRR